MIERDLYAELRTLGFTSDQCCEILDWTERLPMIVYTDNTKVSVKQGIIKVELGNN